MGIIPKRNDVSYDQHSQSFLRRFSFGVFPMAYHRPRFFVRHRNRAYRLASHTAIAIRTGESDIARQ